LLFFEKIQPVFGQLADDVTSIFRQSKLQFEIFLLKVLPPNLNCEYLVKAYRPRAWLYRKVV